jgi:hypothetical protein
VGGGGPVRVGLGFENRMDGAVLRGMVGTVRS